MALRLSSAARPSRHLRTSLPHERPPSSPFSSSSRGGQSAASSSQTSAPLTSATQAFSYLGRAMREVQSADKLVDESRKRFMPNEFLYPHQLTRQVMNAPTRSRSTPRPPLLGPGKRQALLSDPFVASGISPLDHWQNPAFVQDFLNQVGMVRPRRETGLTRKNQKKIGKMVKRARQMGIVAVWSNRSAEGGIGSGPGDSQYFRA